MSRHKGLQAENLACAYLRDHGYTIVARNFACRFGEIDIIALKEGVLHFVEVKSCQHGAPIHALTPTKLERITKTIQVYLQTYTNSMPYCVDAVLIQGTLQNYTIEWLENIGL
ncbi:YraN family protein [Helicobacter salomonis]|uniref:YraN family protein n=1 Tax=Helicobacter salomonis TaxID=56878 RepID=UPI000CF19734|nr:YraN family protein [Helicobacter salomonis]